MASSEGNMDILGEQGFVIHRKLFSREDVSHFRCQAESVSKAAGTVCVRHLRRRSQFFDTLSFSATILSLLPVDYRPVRSILFDKTPEENWPVPWHQDLTIAVAEKNEVPGYGPWSIKDGSPHVQPPVSLLEKMITVRIHLDESDAVNGTLRVIPGSHGKGKLDATELEKVDKGEAVSCECSPGDVLVMSPLLLHSSRRSERPSRRRVVHFEYARAYDLHPGLSWYEPPVSET